MASCGARTNAGARCKNPVGDGTQCAAGHPVTAAAAAAANGALPQAAAADPFAADAPDTPAWSPAAEAEFDAIWRGETRGFSEAKVHESLAEAQQMRDDLAAGKVKPRHVIGTGYKQPRKVAFEYLDRRIEECERDLASEGRTCAVNVSNVKYRLGADALAPSTN